MTKHEFLSLMQFPKEWLDWGLYPDELFEVQLAGYQPGHETGSEHDRNGAFHWWLRQEPSAEVLVSLAKLTFLDSDSFMASDVRNHIKKSKHFNAEVAASCQDPT